MTRDELITHASSYISNTAYPNPNKFTIWFFKNTKEHAWCGAFIDYLVKNELGCNWLDSCSNFAYVPTISKWAKDKGYWSDDYTKAKKGDLVVFNFNLHDPSFYSHIGIVEKQIKDGIQSIDGNTNNEYYTKNCVLRKTRNKKYIKGVILLPYKEEPMDFKVGDYVIALADVNLYTSIEYKESKYTIKKGDKAYIRYIKDNNIALADPVSQEYYPSAWTNELDKFLKYDPTDYKILYEEELAKNKVLTDKNNGLQNKIDKAIEVLNG